MAQQRTLPTAEAFHPPQLPETTTVLFPRFEFETDPHLRPNERKTVSRAVGRSWLPLVEVDQVLDPKALAAESRWLNVMGNWYGEHHVARFKLTLGRLYQSPFTDTNQLFRTTYIKHEYLWDSQGITGSATEIVLERLQLHSPVFDEMMAILIHGSSLSSKRETQRVVMKNPDGDWQEPEFGRNNPERDFYFALLHDLATRGGTVTQ